VTNERPGTHLSIEELSAFRDGAPSAPERRAHVDGCPECRREVAAWMSIGESILALADESLPPGLETRILRRLRDGSAAGLPAWLGFWARPIGVATALVLLVASVVTADRMVEERSEVAADWFWAAGLEAGSATSFGGGALDSGVEFLAPGGAEAGAADGESLGGGR
jgi:anti-sigma factor RsiW